MKKQDVESPTVTLSKDIICSEVNIDIKTCVRNSLGKVMFARKNPEESLHQEKNRDCCTFF